MDPLHAQRLRGEELVALEISGHIEEIGVDKKNWQPFLGIPTA
jgi:hypothetical protein